MSDLAPALIALVQSLARAAAAEAIKEERRNPPDRTSGTRVEIASPHRARRCVSDEVALRRAIEAAIAEGAVPVRAELFADGRTLLFFDSSGSPGTTEGWREVLDAWSPRNRNCGKLCD